MDLERGSKNKVHVSLIGVNNVRVGLLCVEGEEGDLNCTFQGRVSPV
jgi:hypothetical protein